MCLPTLKLPLQRLFLISFSGLCRLIITAPFRQAVFPFRGSFRTCSQSAGSIISSAAFNAFCTCVCSAARRSALNSQPTAFFGGRCQHQRRSRLIGGVAVGNSGFDCWGVATGSGVGVTTDIPSPSTHVSTLLLGRIEAKLIS
jgi:hypothetical protein